MPVATSVAFTVAFGTTPPDGSVTVPLIVPRNVCAFPATASDNTIRIAITKRFIRFNTPLIEVKIAPASPDPLGARFEELRATRKPHWRPTAICCSVEIRHLIRTSPRTSPPYFGSNSPDILNANVPVVCELYPAPPPAVKKKEFHSPERENSCPAAIGGEFQPAVF